MGAAGPPGKAGALPWRLIAVFLSTVLVSDCRAWELMLGRLVSVPGRSVSSPRARRPATLPAARLADPRPWTGSGRDHRGLGPERGRGFWRLGPWRRWPVKLPALGYLRLLLVVGLRVRVPVVVLLLGCLRPLLVVELQMGPSVLLLVMIRAHPGMLAPGS